MALNVACFIAMVCSSSVQSLLIPSSMTLLNWGASSASETIAAHQFWRLFTCSFVHAGILHLGINLFVLRDIGREVEKAYGHLSFSLIYLLSACGGALTSIFVNPLLISAGASGAIFGSFGAMLAVVWRRPENFPRGYLLLHGKIVGFLILYSIVFSFIDKNTDNAAHFGGCLVGFLAGLCFLPVQRNQPESLKKTGAALLILVLFAVTFLAYRQLSNRPDVLAETYYRKAVQMLKEKNYAAALPLLDMTIAKAPDNANAYCDRARANLELKHFDRAIADCTRALRDKNVESSAYAIRAAIYQKIGNYAASVKDLTSLIDLDAKDSMAYNNRAWSEEALGQLDAAVRDCDNSLRLKSDSATTYDTRGVAHILLNDFERAKVDLAQAIKLKQNDGAFYYHLMIAKRRAGQSFDLERQKFLELGYTPESWEPR